MKTPFRVAAFGALALAIMLATAGSAQAHLASSGLGPVYDGAWHLLLTPAQLATLGAAALFAGRRGPAAARRSFLLVPLVWLLGCVAGPLAPAASLCLGACAMLAAGVLLASDAPLGPVSTPAAVAVIAAVSGLAYDGVMAPEDAAGAVAALSILLALLASITLPLRRAVPIIALRVAGSWTAALGLLLIGWWVRGRTV